MKMIIRMLCAAALVFGAVSLTGCGDKDKGKDSKPTNGKPTGAQASGQSNTNGQSQAQTPPKTNGNANGGN